MSSNLITLKQGTIELGNSLNYDSEIKIEKLIQLLQITKNKKNWNNDNVTNSLIEILRFLLFDIDKQVRVQSARAMRYITHNNNIFNKLNNKNIPILMMRCLEREDNKFLWERMQSLKWIRHIISIKNINKYKFPRCIVQTLIAISMNNKDEFRRICLDSLRELLMINPKLINECNGFKCIIQSILDISLNDISNSLILTLLYILDHP